MCVRRLWERQGLQDPINWHVTSFPLGVYLVLFAVFPFIKQRDSLNTTGLCCHRNRWLFAYSIIIILFFSSAGENIIKYYFLKTILIRGKKTARVIRANGRFRMWARAECCGIVFFKKMKKKENSKTAKEWGFFACISAVVAHPRASVRACSASFYLDLNLHGLDRLFS